MAIVRVGFTRLLLSIAPLLALGCTGIVDGTVSGGAPGSAGATGVPADGSPKAPTAISCTKDAAFPRRISRLSEREYLNTVSSLAKVPDAAVPNSFKKPALGAPPDGNLAVTRTFQQDADKLASAAADLLMLEPEAQSCSNFGADAACTTQLIQSLGARALRGPLDAAGLAALTDLAAAAAARSTAQAALKLTLRALLLTPRALYTTEGVVKDDGSYGESGGLLSNVELASYLAYRTTELPPTAALLQALQASGARTAEGLGSLLSAQLGENFLASATDRFLASWLGIDAISRLSLDTAKHSDVSASYLSDLQGETASALNAAAQDPNLTLRSLLLTPTRSTIAGDDEGGFLTSVGRPGVFALPGVIAAASGNNETNIPRRGRAILKSLFCETLANPPAGAVSQAPAVPANATQRERFARVEASGGACTGCHSRIDGLALPFERYDELGRMRNEDEHGNALDPSGSHSLPDGTVLNYADAAQLMELSAGSDAAQKCLTVQVFRNLNRRDDRGDQDGCLLGSADSDAKAQDFSIPRLLSSVLVRSALAPRSDP